MQQWHVPEKKKNENDPKYKKIARGKHRGVNFTIYTRITAEITQIYDL